MAGNVTKNRVITVVVVLLVVWIAVAIIGFVVKALLWLAVVAIVLFVATLLYGAVKARTRR